MGKIKKGPKFRSFFFIFGSSPNLLHHQLITFEIIRVLKMCISMHFALLNSSFKTEVFKVTIKKTRLFRICYNYGTKKKGKNMRKNFIIVITAIFTLFSFACADNNPAVAPNPSDNPQAELSSYDVADSEKVTYCVIGFDPAYYNVYIFTEESFSHYDYTHYWVGSKDGLDYFNGTAPVGEEYLVDEGPMSEEVWIDIKKALTDGKFKKLPEDLHVDDIFDGTIFEIEVLDDSERYFSGGYMAGYGNGIQQKRFNDIRIAFDEAVSECEEYLKNPPKPEVENTDESESTEADVETENESYTPSYNVFADIPDHEGIYDYYSSDGSVFIRQDLNTHKSYINDNGNWIEFNDIYELATGAYGPRIEKFDYDGDGEEDYLIAECEGSGTGFSVYGLVIFKRKEITEDSKITIILIL